MTNILSLFALSMRKEVSGWLRANCRGAALCPVSR